MQKNEEFIVDIIDNGYQGEGIAKIDNFAIFIPGALKGEKVKIVIVKVLKSHAFGKVLEILKKSDYRVEVDCKTYKRCGGCNLRHIRYNETLLIKRNIVQNLVNKNLSSKPKVQETLGMDEPYNYRNKAQYPVGQDKENKPIIGVFANRTHEIIPIENCLIQNEKNEEIAKFIIKYFSENNISVYNEEIRNGLIRHIVTKIGKKTNEIMVIIVMNGDEIPNEKEFVKVLTQNFPKIKTIVKNINKNNTNVILGKKNINLYGDGYIKDKLGDLIFKISPASFYQVNPVQAEKLYKIGIESANITKEDIVFDLYCGIGTISLFMAKYAKKVYGVEIVEEAIKDAKENAKLNSIENTEFIAGDVEEVLNNLINNKKITPDIVMVDPPRKGLDNTSIQNIIKIKPKRIIYISCNPATLVRDLKELEKIYEIKEIKPVDMFPFTSHVECVAVLQLKQDILYMKL